MNDLWLFDMQTHVLRSISIDTPAPEARARHTAHMVGDLLHLFGGYDGAKPIGGEVYTLDCSDPASMESAGSGDKKKDDKAAAADDDVEDA